MAKYASRRLKSKKKTKQVPRGKYKSPVQSKKYPNRNNIIDYFNLCSNFESHITEFRKSWKYTLGESLVFYKIDVTNRPTIIISLKIDKDLKVVAFTEHGKVPKKEMESLLNSEIVLEQWSQLKHLLKHFDAEKYSSCASIQYNLNQSMRHLKSCETINSAKGDAFCLEPKLKFLQNQIHALLRNRYTPYMLFLAFPIYLKSSSCYRYIQSLNFLLLPKEQDLIEYISKNAKKKTHDAK